MYELLFKTALALKFLGSFLLLAQFAQINAADECDAGRSVQQLALCKDFRDIRNLIPANTLINILSSHYRSDEEFRKAMKFLNTPLFDSVSQQISESDVYQQALQQFSNAGVHTEAISNISNIFNCLLLKEAEYMTDEDIQNISMQKVLIGQRSMQTLSSELVNAIPRNDFKTLISNKLRENKDFASFYRIVRSNSFRKQVLNGLKSYQLSYPLSVLERNNIDLSKLAKIIFNLLRKGPSA